jgi:hypothetical protein
MAAIVAAVLLAGCEEEEIRVYTAPADPVERGFSTDAQRGSSTDAQRGSSTRGETGMHWVVPEGWREVGSDQPMRVATLLAGEGERAMEFAVTVFPGDTGGLLANVNRWRGQVGLAPVSAEELEEHVREFRSNGLRGWVMRIGGEGVEGPVEDEQRGSLTRGETGVEMLAGIVEDPAGFTWFVRGVGSPEVVSAHEGDFVGFVRSFHIDAAGGHEHGHVHVHGAVEDEGAGLRPAAKREELSWEVPPHWEAQPPPTPIVYAMFNAPSDGGTAVVTVTPLRGDGGGLLANVNMWRGQIGLEPVSEVGQVPVERVRVGDVDAVVLHVVGGSLNEERRESLTRGETNAIVVAIVPEGDRTWFFRLTGPAAAVDIEKPSLIRLVESVRFTGKEDHVGH